MADGTSVPIEQVELGDEVLAADPTTGEQGAQPVTALIEGTGTKTLVTVETEAGTVITTSGHPFWSVTNHAWVDAVDLDAGDELLTAEGTTQTVTEVTVEQARTIVFNLTVDLLHTYYVAVGAGSALAHNCGGQSSPDYVYSNRVLQRTADEPGPYHSFPSSFDEVILQQAKPVVRPNFFREGRAGMSADSIQYKLPGSVNGRSGHFEIFTRPSESGQTELIMHRFFRPDTP